MKYNFLFALSVIILSCNSIRIKNSREELLKFESRGYTIKLNDSIIKLKRIFLDDEKIKKIEIDNSLKTITLIRENNDLNFVPMSFIAKKDETDKLIVIDETPIENLDIDSTNIEMSAIKSVEIIKDASSLHGKNFKEIIIVKTHNDR